MQQKIIHTNGIELYTEHFGNPSNPAILLIMGAQASLVWWEEAFCNYLADEGRFVIRYDNRDVGRSTFYEPGKPDYTFEHMADDAIEILNAYGIQRAHFVGMSMGGMLTQMIALRHPERVDSVTLISASNFAPDLPPVSDKVMEFFLTIGEVDWADEKAVVELAVAKAKVLSGWKYPIDEERVALLSLQEMRRGKNLASMSNHALVAGGEGYLTRTSEIAVPALIIHGSEDPLVPYAHGAALAAAIPNSTILPLEGTGHELPFGDWDEVVRAIVRHTSYENKCTCSKQSGL
ncbi:alpha/beta fold hydrolase [Paenibacillus sp. GCM10027627]|uniref:alpha/beta fold hydrolase n=1 Tax=unclassified Paenibacillus TaxID=185978 RepID=UPI003645F27F